MPHVGYTFIYYVRVCSRVGGNRSQIVNYASPGREHRLVLTFLPGRGNGEPEALVREFESWVDGDVGVYVLGRWVHW